MVSRLLLLIISFLIVISSNAKTSLKYLKESTSISSETVEPIDNSASLVLPQNYSLLKEVLNFRSINSLVTIQRGMYTTFNAYDSKASIKGIQKENYIKTSGKKVCNNRMKVSNCILSNLSGSEKAEFSAIPLNNCINRKKNHSVMIQIGEIILIQSLEWIIIQIYKK